MIGAVADIKNLDTWVALSVDFITSWRQMMSKSFVFRKWIRFLLILPIQVFSWSIFIAILYQTFLVQGVVMQSERPATARKAGLSM